MLDKLREYAEKKFGELDQLFIFFAGHGFYDDTFKEGLEVTRESLPDDPGRNSYLRHSVVAPTINNNSKQDIFSDGRLFRGTFDENVGTRAMTSENVSKALSTIREIITRKLKLKRVST